MKKIIIMLCITTSSLHTAFFCRPKKTAVQTQQKKTEAMWKALYADNLTEFKKQFQEAPYPSFLPKEERSPFLYACFVRNIIIASWLLEHAFDFPIDRQDLNEALLTIANDCSEPFIRLLLAHGAQINTQSKYGYTPLMRAVLSQNAYMVELFLKLEADISIKNNEGLTARQLLHHTYETAQDFPHQLWRVFEEHSRISKITKKEAEETSEKKEPDLETSLAQIYDNES